MNQNPQALYPKLATRSRDYSFSIGSYEGKRELRPADDRVTVRVSVRISESALP